MGAFSGGGAVLVAPTLLKPRQCSHQVGAVFSGGVGWQVQGPGSCIPRAPHSENWVPFFAHWGSELGVGDWPWLRISSSLKFALLGSLLSVFCSQL